MYDNTIRTLCDKFSSVGIMIIQQPNPSKVIPSQGHPSVCWSIQKSCLSVCHWDGRQFHLRHPVQFPSIFLKAGFIAVFSAGQRHIQRRAAPHSAPAYRTIKREKKRKVHEIDVQQNIQLLPGRLWMTCSNFELNRMKNGRISPFFNFWLVGWLGRSA